MNWKNLLESVSESLNDHLQLRTAYLIAENRILRHQIDDRVQLTESERKELAEIGQQLVMYPGAADNSCGLNTG
jgi:hypothetical protein